MWKSKKRSRLADMSFRKKLQLAFVAVIMVPTLLLGGFLYYSSITYMREQMQQELQNMVSQNVQDITSKMGQCETSLTYAVCNYSLQEFLQDDSLSNLEINTAATTYIGPLLYNILLSNPYLDRLEIFMPRQIAVLSDIIKPSSQQESSQWYQTALGENQPRWWSLDGRFYITRKIVGVNNRDIGVMRIRIKDELFSGSFNNYLRNPMSIDIRQGEQAIYRKAVQNHDPEDADQVLGRPLSETGWTLQYIVGRSYYQALNNPRLLVAFLTTVICLLVVGVVIYYLSGSLVKRIHLLSHQMMQVRDGDLEVEVDTTGSDEIGMLASSFQAMLDRLKILINQVLRAEIEQKDLQLQLLQTKINPHFLYNNLSTINWMAMESGNQEIINMTKSLSAFYRTALNRGQDKSTVETELKNAEAYMELQAIAHEHSFTYHCEVDEGLLACRVPGFILQPLLENALEHGTDQRRQPGAKITTQVYRQGGKLVMEVVDNGRNLDQEIQVSTIDEIAPGYGLRNVDARVRLLCGKGCGVRLYPREDGTVAEIILLMNL